MNPSGGMRRPAWRLSCCQVMGQAPSRIPGSAGEARRADMETARAIIRLLRPHKDRGRTITFDNGRQFAWHGGVVRALGCKRHFAQPRHSREKGCAENAKGLRRQRIPKRMRLEGVTARQVETMRLRKSITVRAGAWTG